MNNTQQVNGFEDFDEQAANAEHVNRLWTDAEYRKAQAIERIDSMIAELQYQRKQLECGKTLSDILPGEAFGIYDAYKAIKAAMEQKTAELNRISIYGMGATGLGGV